MLNNLQGNPWVDVDIGIINPHLVNPRLLKDFSGIINPIVLKESPKKRSGFSHAIYVIFIICVQMMQLSPNKEEEWIYHEYQDKNISFQRYTTLKFANNKNHRFFPDQSSRSSSLKRPDELGCMKEFWNLLLFAHLFYLYKIKLISTDVELIADYKEKPYKKNENDLYCFGKKDGKNKHKTLTFSIISDEYRQIISNFKIKKQ